MAPAGRDRALLLDQATRATSAPAHRDGVERDRHAGNTTRPGDIFQAFADANRGGVQVGGKQRLQRAASADIRRRVNDLRHESRFIRLTDKVKDVNGHAFAEPRAIPRTHNLSQSWGGPTKHRHKGMKIKSAANLEDKSPPPLAVQGGQAQALRTLQHMMGGGREEKATKQDGKAGPAAQIRTMRSSLACLLSAGLAKATENPLHHHEEELIIDPHHYHEGVTTAPLEEDIGIATVISDDSQGLLLDFAGFILDLGGGSLKGAWEKIDAEFSGRLSLMDWVLGLDNAGYDGQDGDAETIFRHFDQDGNAFVTLREFHHLQPYLGIVLAAATRKQCNIEQENKVRASDMRRRISLQQRMTDRASRQSHWPGQEKTSFIVDHAGVSNSTIVETPMKHERPETPAQIINRIMVFANGSPSHTGVYLRFPRPVRDMQDLYSLLDRVCRPLVGRICAVFDQSLNQLQATSALREGAWYLVKGEEKLAPPVLFLRYRAARGAPKLVPPIQAGPFRASTASSNLSRNPGFDITWRPGTSPACICTEQIQESREASCSLEVAFVWPEKAAVATADSLWRRADSRVDAQHAEASKSAFREPQASTQPRGGLHVSTQTLPLQHRPQRLDKTATPNLT